MINSQLVKQHQAAIQSRYQGSIRSFNHSYSGTVESPVSRCWLGEKGSVDGPQYLCSHLCRVSCMIYVASVVPQIKVSLVNKSQFLWIGVNGLESGTLGSTGRWSFSFKGPNSALHLDEDAKTAAPASLRVHCQALTGAFRVKAGLLLRTAEWIKMCNIPNF